MSFKFIATGDTIVTCPYTKDYKGYREMVAYIRSADVRMNNMENPLLDGDSPAGEFSGIPWLRAPTSLLDDMDDFGFNCFGFANNHNLDYFYDGLLSTLDAFEKRALPVAGAGRDLESATRHCKVETPKGSLALVALTTTIDPSARAGEPNGNILGRPGVSMLRHSEKYFVTEAQMRQLEEIAEVTKVSSRLKNRRKLGSVSIENTVFPFGPLEFEIGPVGRMTYPNPYDMERYEEAVKAACRDADHTVVYIHSHETKGDLEMEPDYFVETFARACVDWGAEVVVCSGTHQIKGVEIYRGKPIYYSIANFFFRPYECAYYPTEWYERYHIDKSLSVEEAENLRSQNGKIGLFRQAYAFRSISPMVEWDDSGNIVRIAAKPISLGFHDSMKSKGFPRPADEEDIEALYQQLVLTCEPYGTTVTLDSNKMFVFTKNGADAT